MKRFLFKKYRVLRKLYLMYVDFIAYINSIGKFKNKAIIKINKQNKIFWSKESNLDKNRDLQIFNVRRKSMEDKEKVKQKQLEKNREQLIRERTPIHSKNPNKNWYDNYDRIFKKEK
jgi:hypothetical protein